MLEVKGRSLSSRRLLPALLLLFVGSGCAALIYEVVWFQLLELVIGSSAVSMGVLLGTFMGGMCIGSLMLPRIIPPSIHPLRLYAWLELGIGAIGLLVLFGMPALAGAYAAWAGTGVVGILLRGAAAAICLLPPTLLMGATLPAIARWVERTPDGVAWLGFFYGGNTAGAVLGSLLAGFYLLSFHDVSVTTYVAVALNATVGVLAVTIARVVPWTAPQPRDTTSLPLCRGRSTIYLVIGMSGLTALASEVIWTRLLSLLLGGTVYTFSLILAVFLAGLGIGSSVGAATGRTLQRPAQGARVVPDRSLCSSCLDRLRAHAVAAVLARESLPCAECMVPVSARPRTMRVRGSAGSHPVGCELSSRARGARVGRR